MKKKILAVLVLAFLLALSMASVVWADTIKYGVTGGYIQFDTRKGLITSADKSITAANIPAMINDVVVTGIDNGAFIRCHSLTSVTIPNSVTFIGTDAFSDCNVLASITIPDSVTSIGERTFRDCIGLTSLTIPDSVIDIGRNAFEGCSGLTNLTISNNLTSIGNCVFRGCSGLTNVVIPDSVTYVDSGAFSACSSLTTITLPVSVTTIGYDAFYKCNNLRDIYYNGTEEQWQQIEMVPSNYDLNKLTIHYKDDVNNDNNNENGASISFLESNTSVLVGEEISIFANIYQLNGLQESDITWSSSNEAVAVVTPDFLFSMDNIDGVAWAKVKGVSNGVATITVTLPDGRTASCQVIVGDKIYSMRVYSDKPTLTNYVGDSFDINCVLYKNGQKVSDWETPSVVISDSSVLSVVESFGSKNMHCFNITGLKEGQSTLTITDSDSGAYVTLNFNFGYGISSYYSYIIDNVPSLKPALEPLANFYDINGLYVNNYNAEENSDGSYNVTFDVYNHRYMYGAVDVYNAAGDWIKSQKIDKFTSITSLWDTVESGLNLIKDVVNVNGLDYTASTVAKETHVNIEVPKGGYFTISNNYVDSPGTAFYNVIDFEVLGIKTALKISSSGIKDLNKAIEDIFEDKVFNSGNLSKIFAKKLQSMAISSAKTAKEIGIGEAMGVSTGEFDKLLKNVGLSSVKDAAKIGWGIGESIFEKMAGPAGAVLDILFSSTSLGDSYVQAVQLYNSVNAPYITIMTPDCATIQGVSVTTNKDLADEKSVLQVFRVTNDYKLPEIIANPLENNQYELYNIRFVKEGKEVKMNSTVTVKIPIPDGYNGDKCVVMRQESDGSWTTIDSVRDGKFLVFETTHFSLYAIVDTSPNVTEVNITDEEISLTPGDFRQIAFSINPIEANPKSITWKSSNPSIAFVDEDGVVTAVSVGNVVISAETFNGNVYRCDVVVKETLDNPEENNVYTITFDTDGGYLVGVTSPVKVAWGEKYTMPNANKSGYTLQHWAIGSKESTITAKVNEVYEFTADTTVYAIWEYIGGSSSSGGGGHSKPETTKPEQQGTNNKPGTSTKTEITAENINTIFKDVMPDSWYAKAVAYVYNNGMMNGTTAGIFEPNANTTRAQIVTVLYRREGEPATGTSKFSDVGANQYYTKAVAWAAANGIVKGYSDTEFAPDDNVTREQLAAILFRYAKFKGYDVTVKGNLSSFSDNGQIAGWAVEAMQWALGAGIINGHDNGSIAPNANATRAEVAAMLMRFCERNM